VVKGNDTAQYEPFFVHNKKKFPILFIYFGERRLVTILLKQRKIG